MLGTGLGVLVTGIVLGGLGGLLVRDWEQRQSRSTGPAERARERSDGTLIGWMELRSGGQET
jgi:hypothetical protein